jgi:hypothetical protein
MAMPDLQMILGIPPLCLPLRMGYYIKLKVFDADRFPV